MEIGDNCDACYSDLEKSRMQANKWEKKCVELQQQLAATHRQLQDLEAKNLSLESLNQELESSIF